MQHYPTNFLHRFEGLKTAFDHLPADLASALMRWILWGTRPSDHVTLALEGGTRSALADGPAGALWDMILACLPHGSCGSSEAVASWRGLVHQASEGSAFSAEYLALTASADAVRFWSPDYYNEEEVSA